MNQTQDSWVSPSISNGPIGIPVVTPANNPSAFQDLIRRPLDRPQVIGYQYEGADTMTRVTLALKCQIPEEVSWALSELVQQSLTTPQVFQFKSSGHEILEFLLDLVLSAPFLNTDEPLKSFDFAQIDSDEYNHKCMEALLVLRNTSLDPENAQLLAMTRRVRVLVVKGLWLPVKSIILSEFVSRCCDIAESICFHLTPENNEDSIYRALVHVVTDYSQDRSLIIPALQALARLVIRDKRNLLGELPHELIESISAYLLACDDQLISNTLDFLFQYTGSRRNVSNLIEQGSATTRELLSTHLVSLLTYNIKNPEPEVTRLPRRTKKPIPAGPPTLSQEIIDELLQFSEPDRATNWIRSSYEPEADGEVTQISLWKAYEAQFESYARQGKRLLPAVDFIKNVTTAVRTAAAMVVNLPDSQRRFIIKGIRPREFAISPSELGAQQSAANKASEERDKRADAHNNKPSEFGVTASLVLQHIAKARLGRQLLQSKIADLIHAATLNPTIPTYIDELLDDLDPLNAPQDFDDEEQ